MSYFALMATLFALGAISFYKCKCIVNPATMTCFSYALAVFSAWAGLGNWHHTTELSFATSTAIALSVALLVIIFLAVDSVIRRRRAVMNIHHHCRLACYPSITAPFGIIVCLYVVGVYGLYFIQLMRVVNGLGIPGTLFEKLNTYRSLYIINADSATSSGVGISTAVLQLRNFVDVLIPLLIFEYFRERLLKRQRNTLLAATILTGMLASLLTTGRSLLFSYIFSAAACYSLLLRHTRKKLLAKQLLRILIGCGILIAIFFASNTLLSRNSDMQMFDYLTFYNGSSIINFDLFMQHPSVSSTTQTLDGLSKILQTLGIAITASTRSVSWVEYSGNQSNVFTALFRYYSDAGAASLFAYMAIFAFVMTACYEQARHDKPFWIVLYLMTFFILIDQSREDEFYAYIFRNSFPLLIAFLALLCTHLYDRKRTDRQKADRKRMPCESLE